MVNGIFTLHFSGEILLIFILRISIAISVDNDADVA